MRAYILASLLFLVSGGASAASVEWFVDGSWGDGSVSGTVSGSFFYDADLDNYSNIDILVTDSRLLDSCTPGFCSIGVDFTADDISNFSSGFALDLIADYSEGSGDDLTGKQLLFLSWTNDFSSVLTPDLNPINLALTASFYGNCDNNVCTSASGFPIDGSVSLAVVPLPAAAWLFSSALAAMVGVGYLRRIRTG